MKLTGIRACSTMRLGVRADALAASPCSRDIGIRSPKMSLGPLIHTHVRESLLSLDYSQCKILKGAFSQSR